MDKLSNILGITIIIHQTVLLAVIYYLLKKETEKAKRTLFRALVKMDGKYIKAFKQLKPTMKINDKPIYQKEIEKRPGGKVYSPDSDTMAELEGRKVEMFD